MDFDTRSPDLVHHTRPGSANRAGQALLALAVGALLINSWRWLSRTHQRRQSSRSQPLPRPLQTWEGEGGRPDPEPETSASGSAPTSDCASPSRA